MQRIYKTLNKVQTELLIWGNPFDYNGSDVLICVTGNPGVPDFYIEFGSELHKWTSLPVCVIGQAGHSVVPDSESNDLEGNKQLFDLQGQLAHKLDLISNHIDKASKIHLIGHSIGAWMLLELLHKHDSIYNRVSSINFLFPTLQKMALSPNGKFLNNFLRNIHFLVILLLTVVAFLPKTVFSFLINLYLRFKSLPSHYEDRVMKFLNPQVVEKVLFLAYDEMDTVTTLNLAALDKIKNKTLVVYSIRDGWAPLSYMEDLKVFQPHLTMKEVDIDHSFVLKSSERVAGIVSELIKSLK